MSSASSLTAPGDTRLGRARITCIVLLAIPLLLVVVTDNLLFFNWAEHAGYGDEIWASKTTWLYTLMVTLVVTCAYLGAMASKALKSVWFAAKQAAGFAFTTVAVFILLEAFVNGFVVNDKLVAVLLVTVFVCMFITFIGYGIMRLAAPTT